MKRRSLFAMSAITWLCAVPGATVSAAPPDYHLSKKVDVGGKGAWDYMTYDPTGHRVFVSRTFHVMVLDGESGATVGDIPGTAGVHGIALAPEFGKGFTSNGHNDTVTIFDFTTLKPIGQAPTGKRPDAIIYDPASKRVFTFNSESHDSTAIDAASGRPVGTVPLPGRPEFAVADGQGGVFVNIEDKNSLAAIDSRALMVKATWEMPGCDGPSGLSMDREHRRVFSVCGNKTMAVMDADSGKLVATVPIGDGPDASTFSPKLGMAFSPNGQDGTLTVVHEDSPDKFTVAGTVKTESGARTMALDEDTGTVYLVTSTVGPTLILSFIFEIFRSYARPGEAIVGGLLVLIGLWLLFGAQKKAGSKKPLWGGILLVVGVVLAVASWQYDAVQLALSPADFHLTIWR
jgi:DNA-binding beta-propeller fold protein YncE